MATYDNKIWLLKNIREAFIATDDTGLCETVMVGEDLAKIFRATPSTMYDDQSSILEDEDHTERVAVSQFDPYPDMENSDDDDVNPGSYIRDDIGLHRQRPNPAPILDKKEIALKKAAKLKVIKWENPLQLTSDELAGLFPISDVKNIEPKSSLFAKQLENCPELPHRHYVDFARFDGTSQIGLPTKTFKIFMTMLPEKYQNYPLIVCVIASAKIRDLIGFVCYKYSIDHPEVTLGSVQDYGLCIAEDDGEVDWAFPCLDINEPCSKFGFTCLGLIELKNKIKQQQQSMESYPAFSGVFQGILKASESSHSNPNPSRHNTGGSATSEAVLNALKAVNEERRAAGDAELGKMHSHIMAAEAPQYKAYRVQLLRKVRANSPVQLIISLERIEIEPLVPNKAFWSTSKYFLHTIDTVAWCQILESKGNKSTFRIVYSPNHSHTSNERHSGGNTNFFHPSTSYKLHDFEADHEVAKEVVERVNTILDLRNSPCRREYKNSKEKKLLTRRSFHTKNFS